MSAGQGETAEQEWDAESLRDVRARAEAFLASGQEDYYSQSNAASFARDAIALTDVVERLLVRVQQLEANQRTGRIVHGDAE